MERRVDDAELIRDRPDCLRIDGLAHDLLKEGLVRLDPDDSDLPLFDGLGIVAGLIAGENIRLGHPRGDRVGMLGRQLGAVGPVDLIAVILLGIVAGRDVQAGRGAVVTHGKAELGRWAQRIKNAHIDAVGSHDRSRFFGILASVQAAVMRDDDALLPGGLALGADDIGKGLGRMADDVDIHVVQAGLHRAAQTGGTELQRCEETLADFLLILADGIELGPLALAESGAVQPVLILFHERSHNSASRNLIFAFCFIYGKGFLL